MKFFNVSVEAGLTKYQEDEKTPTSRGIAAVLENMALMAFSQDDANQLILAKVAGALKIRERELERLKDEMINYGRCYLGGFRFWAEPIDLHLVETGAGRRFAEELLDLLPDSKEEMEQYEDPKTVELIG